MGLSPVNRLIVVAICAAVLLAMLETEPTLTPLVKRATGALQAALTGLFLVEYAARAWIAPERPGTAGGWRGRLRYLGSPMALVDLAALAPALVGALGGGGETMFLRLVRLVRILRLARLGRFSNAMNTVADAVGARRYELSLSVLCAGGLLLVSSSLLYVTEAATQPEAFGSIPRSMWWSIETLTTVGYGDTYPVTALGKVFASVTAIIGIGLVAMPTGILAAAFSDALQHARRTGDKAPGEGG